ncbi:baculoviral IAP repeat-containing protein 7-like [Arctopsyche grandis]|uniref:baculoviral IAP repeat-containing protein 7-like n=1 Tax=Arctopsyche grandis TaxID=121162 RepID=UPI00406D8BF6
MSQLIKINKEEERLPTNFNYMTFRSRILTFRDWPCSLPLCKTKVAKAGFYYAGKGAEMTCYFCNGSIKHPVEDPWLEHAKLDTKCQFMELLKGTEFIDAAKENKPGVDLKQMERKRKTHRQNLLKGNCTICNTNQKNASFIPCGHLLTCMECSASFEMCPFCNVQIKYKVKTYI